MRHFTEYIINNQVQRQTDRNYWHFRSWKAGHHNIKRMYILCKWLLSCLYFHIILRRCQHLTNHWRRQRWW